MVEGVVGADELVGPHRLDHRGHLLAGELGGDAEAELARRRPIVPARSGKHPQGHELIGRGEIYFPVPKNCAKPTSQAPTKRKTAKLAL